MKRVKILAASATLVGAAIAGTIALQNQSAVDMHFLRNAEALARSEGTHSGICYGISGPCISYCPVCGIIIEDHGSLGPAGPLSGCYH